MIICPLYNYNNEINVVTGIIRLEDTEYPVNGKPALFAIRRCALGWRLQSYHFLPVVFPTWQDAIQYLGG